MKRTKPFTKSHNPKQYYKVANQTNHLINAGIQGGYTLALWVARAEWLHDFWMQLGASWADGWLEIGDDYNSQSTLYHNRGFILDIWSTEFNWDWKEWGSIN